MEGVGRREREKERVWRVHAKIKTVSEARFEEKQRDRTENGNEKGIGIGRTPLFLLYESRSFPPSSALCHSLERNDVRSGLFIVVKNTSKCPSSPARDKGQPPLLSVSLWFPWRCIGGTATSLVSTVFPPSIPWFPLSELCSDRRSEPHSPTLTLGNGASASLRRGKKYRKGAKVIEPFLSSSSSLRPIIFFVAKSTLEFLLSYSARL